MKLLADIPYRVARAPLSFGCDKYQKDAAPKKSLVHVFTDTEHSRPQVFTYDVDNEQGRKDLANLLRCEDVIAAVKGTRVQFSVESVVSLQIGDQAMEHRVNSGD